MRRVGRRVVFVGTLLAALLGLSASASASTFVVNITSDEFNASNSGCSLREAIEAANTDGSFAGCIQPDQNADTIVLQSGAVYQKTLTGSEEDSDASGDLDISSEDLTITTSGGGGATIENSALGSTWGRILQIIGPITVNISRVTISNGYSDLDRDGGGINNAGTLNLDHSLVYFNNTASTLAAQGGGIYNSGTLHATNDTFSVNAATGSGGAIFSTGTATLNNDTVSGNLGDGVSPGDTTAAGGVTRAGGTLTMSNTLVAGNAQNGILFHPAQTAPDCSGGPTSLGYNLIGDPTGCGWSAATGDLLPVASPGLANAGIADNGGPTKTIALQPGSPAIDAGNPGPADGLVGDCEATDQRLVARPVGTRCDIGAFETANPPAPQAPAPAPAASTPPFDLAAALKKCKKKPTKQKRKRCRQRARHQAGLS